jgi:hypothetical protein
MPDEYRMTGRTSELAKRAAKSVQQHLASEASLDAICWMTQGYGRVMAAAWRRQSQRNDENDERKQLFDFHAEASEELAAHAAEYWPVADVGGRLAFLRDVQPYAETSFVDPDSPGENVDLHLYFAEAGATCGALALLLGDQLHDELRALLSEVVRSYDLFFSAQLLSIWNASGDAWVNLFGSQPYTWMQMLEFSNAGVSPFGE